MTVVLCIAMYLALFANYDVKGSAAAVVAMFVARAVLILGLATLALLSSGWTP